MRMALTETKIMQTQNSPEIINSLNGEMGSFGWNVLSIQVTHTQNTKTYTKGLDMLLSTGVDTVETTTIEYATIAYQRDRQMQNYAEITALEQRYFFLRNELTTKVNQIEAADRVKFTDLLCQEVKSAFILNPIKRWNKSIEIFKKSTRYVKSKMGVDARSENAIQRSNELIDQYDQQLRQIRIQAEALL